MDERTALLGMLLVDGIGPARIRQLEQRFHSAQEAWENRRHWTSLPGFSEALVGRALAVTQKDIDRQRTGLEKLNARLIIDTDPDYPPGLHHLPNPPKALFVRGCMPTNMSAAVAIVGTRRPSSNGLATAQALSRDLAAVGLVVVSGLARGIDGAAHTGALEAGGQTIAVLGCGLDIAYPPEHGQLMEQIALDGGIVTEYPLGTAPRKPHFPLRNRIIAGMCQGVIVPECGRRSGALHTANVALDLGREVMAVPGDVFRWQSEGPNELIRQGATLVRNAGDVLLALGWTTLPDKAPAFEETAAGTETASLRPVGDISQQVLTYLRANGPASVDDVAEVLRLSVHDVAAALTWMELLGRVQREPGGLFSTFR